MPTIQLPAWVSHPGRGTLRSMHGTLQPSLSTGAAHVRFPLELTSARSLTPELSLDYHSNQGNGVFGMGFDLSGLISVTRNTKHGVPSYDESDTFVLSTAGELVQISDDAEDTDGWKEYRPRVDSQFSKILYHSAHGWIIYEANGVNHYLRESLDSCVADPDNVARVFEWKVSRTKDAHGNEIHYSYELDGADRYLSRIRYGTLPLGGLAFDLVFDYGKEDSENKTLDDNPLWGKTDERPDQFTSYRSGFALSTKRLCHRIALYHHFDDFAMFPSGRALVKYWALNYNTDKTQEGLSSLVSMQETGCRTLDGKSYLSKALPAATFKYQTLQLKEMEPFKLSANSALPALRGSYQWIDLYREGLPGILYNDDTTALYWRSKGGGEFAAPEPLTQFPNTFHPSFPTHCRVMHLGPYQETAFVVVTPNQSGYYLLNEQATKHEDDAYQPGWQKEAYHPFQQMPSSVFTSPWNEVMDLNGSNQEDLLVLDPMFPYYYPSQGTLGYGKPQPLDLQLDFPAPQFDSEVLVRFVDIFGDGLLHRVKITEDGVSIWPNLGHGTFGEKIDWDLPALKESIFFDARCVFLTDIDGSGAVDFVYATTDHVTAYLNVGAGFSSRPLVLELPESYTHHDQLLFGDFFGNAVTSVMLIKTDFDEVRYYHGSFASEKPYLLKEMTQSFGVKTHLRYSTSSVMQRAELERINKNSKVPQDVLTGSRLPFSLPLLSQMTVVDPLTEVHVTTEYAYYQGHYDFLERRFCGFGFVQEFRGETTVGPENNNKKTEDPTHGKIEQSETRHWFHNAATPDTNQFPPFLVKGIKGSDTQSDQAALYYKKDESNQGERLDLSDTLTLDKREAQLSAQGRQWRMELWVGEHPLHIEQIVYNVRCDNEREVTEQVHGVFTLQQRMSVSLQLEPPVDAKAAVEARISQSANLLFDSYNNVLKEAHIAVGRVAIKRKIKGAPFVLDKQSQKRLQSIQQPTQIVYKQTQYAKPLTELASKEDFHYLHLTAEVQVFDLSEEGTEPKTHKELLALEPTPEHLHHLEQHLYWDAAQKKALLLGQWEKRALVHHSVGLLGSAKQTHTWYESLLVSGAESIEKLLTGNGYVSIATGPDADASKQWWQPGQIHHYGGAKNYYQLEKITDPYPEANKDPALFHRMQIIRDEYKLVPNKVQHYLTSDKAPSVTKMKIDYHTLQPYQVIDSNNITHVCVHDPLGVVIAQTRYKGKLGNPIEGLSSKYASIAFDIMHKLNQPVLSKVIADKASYLGGWLFVKTYATLLPAEGSEDLQDSAILKPAYKIELRHSDYAQKPKRLVSSNEDQIYCTVTHFDGSGHVVQRARQKEEGSWMNSGAQLLDEHGHVLTQFLPHESASLEYEAIAKLPLIKGESDGGASKQQGVTEIKSLRIMYDGAFRPVTQHLPNNCQRQTQHHAWYRINLDENTSTKYPSSPEVVFLTPAGEMGGTLKQLDTNILETTRYNIAGQPICHQDARLVGEENQNLKLTYNLLGRVIVHESVDRGLELALHNALGKVTRHRLGEWLHEDVYDAWERMTGKRVWADSEWINTEQRTYGDSPANNQFNQLVLLQNEEAITRFKQFDLDGHCIAHSRELFLPQLSADSSQEKAGPHPYQNDHKESAKGIFSFKAEYDALGNLLAEKLPDGAIYNHHHNALAQLIGIDNSQKKPVVSGMDYNAAGFMTHITRGKTPQTTQSYDPETQRLIAIQTPGLQDQTYAYDNVGNVVAMNMKNPMGGGKAQTLHYAYDPLYRLISADALELTKLRVQSDSKKIAHQLFSTEMAVRRYTQTFKYDCSGNITRIQHGDSWDLDFKISEKSNRFKQLTTPDNKLLKASSPLYDAAGNMLKTDEKDALEWSHDNELQHVSTEVGQGSEHGVTEKVDEYYGYDASEGVPFEDKIKHRHTLGLFGRGLKPTKEKLLKAFGNRLYKVSVFKHTSGFKVIEQIFLGRYERKQIYTGVSLEKLELVLVRHTHRFELDGQPLATYHHWEKDSATLETEVVGKSTQWQYHLSDLLHSSLIDVDAKGQKLTERAYQPYGAIAYIRTSDEKQLLRMDYHYSGKMHDRVTGLYYYGARYYAPQFGRWISPDPAGLVDGLNLYGMVRNNPMTFLDVWGLSKSSPSAKLGRSRWNKRAKPEMNALKHKYGVKTNDQAFRIWKKGREAQHLIPTAICKKFNISDEFRDSADNGIMLPSGRARTHNNRIQRLDKNKVSHIKNGGAHPPYSAAVSTLIEKYNPKNVKDFKLISDALRGLHKTSGERSTLKKTYGRLPVPAGITHSDDLVEAIGKLRITFK